MLRLRLLPLLSLLRVRLVRLLMMRLIRVIWMRFLGIRRLRSLRLFRIPIVPKFAVCCRTSLISSLRLRALPRWLLLRVLCLMTFLVQLCFLCNRFILIGLSVYARLLTDADACLAVFLALGRDDFSFLPSRFPAYAVRGEFAQGCASPINPSLLSLFEHPLRSNHQLGLTIHEAAALESSFRAHSESLSHSMWLLSELLAFIHLQGFAPEDAVLFDTLVTSLAKSLAHQASVSASHTAFIGLKRREFYFPTYRRISLILTNGLCFHLRWSAPIFCLTKWMYPVYLLMFRPFLRCALNKPWWIWLLVAPVTVSGTLVLAVPLLVPRLCVVVAVILVRLPVRQACQV